LPVNPNRVFLHTETTATTITPLSRFIFKDTNIEHMQRFAKKPGDKKNNPEEEHIVQKRRTFALVGGLIGVVAVFVYLVSSAYPEKLFSMFRHQESTAEHMVVPPVHPALPNSLLKTHSLEIFSRDNKVMAKQFDELGKTYTAPALQLFEDTISAYECGQGLPSTGAFYCPANNEMYIDLAFFRALAKRDSAIAPLSREYIIGHQVGHHIEQLLGITAKVAAMQGEVSDADFKKLNDKLELLADYYAGVWMRHALHRQFDTGDAATILADATKLSTALAQNPDIAVPDPYSYANLGERSNVFYRGYRTGSIKQADIFAAGDLK